MYKPIGYIGWLLSLGFVTKHILVNPIQIIRQDPFCKLLAGLSNSHAINLLLLDFVIKHTLVTIPPSPLLIK